MSEVALVLGAYPRILAACRPREVADPAGPGGVTEHQARALSHLDRVDPVMVTELADFLGVRPSTMSVNLTRLERAGFVERSRDPADRRVVNVRLTEAGARVRDSLSLLDPQRVDAMLGLLVPVQRRRAVEGLALLAEAADALVARGSDYVDALTGRDAE